MILGFSPAQVLRGYLAAVISLGAAAYFGGIVTADICQAYDSGSVVGRPMLVDSAGGKTLVRSRPLLCA